MAVATSVIVDVNASRRIEHQAPHLVFGELGDLLEVEDRTNPHHQVVDGLP